MIHRLFFPVLLAIWFVAGRDVTTQICTNHTFLGNRPDEGNPGWESEANGLAHDHDHWYVTQNYVTNFGFTNPQIYRIPVTQDLAGHVTCSSSGVSCSNVYPDVLPLYNQGYDHYGDPDFYEHEGEGYLLVPVERKEGGRPPGVAVFRANATLDFLAFAPLAGQTAWSWVAVDANGNLVSSNGGGVGQLTRYRVDWSGLTAVPLQFSPQPIDPIVLYDETSSPLSIDSLQGGEFSDDGQLLYISAGYYVELFGPGVSPEGLGWGIHVFETRPGSGSECGGAASCVVATRVEKSHNGPGGFAFEFEPAAPAFQETEGLTFWDLDADGRAPNIGGQLHVILLDNDNNPFDLDGDPNDDDVYVKHYRLSLGDSSPPAITCPADAVVECSVYAGVPAIDPLLSAFFAGISAIDNCDRDPAISHNAPAQFGLGTTPVTFSAIDHFNNASQCVARVTVVDTTPPSIECPAPVTVECTGPSGIRADDPQLISFLQGARATDRCDAAPQVSNDAPASLSLGQTVVTFRASDGSTNVASCISRVNVADTVGPSITVGLSQDILWPPDHRLIPITTTVNVLDRCDPGASFRLVSITSNEPDDGLGDGDTPNDIRGVQLGTADTTFLLRAERSGTGVGRIYTIVYRAVDSAGNTRDVTVYVRVPLF